MALMAHIQVGETKGFDVNIFKVVKGIKVSSSQYLKRTIWNETSYNYHRIILHKEKIYNLVSYNLCNLLIHW